MERLRTGAAISRPSVSAGASDSIAREAEEDASVGSVGVGVSTDDALTDSSGTDVTCALAVIGTGTGTCVILGVTFIPLLSTVLSIVLSTVFSTVLLTTDVDVEFPGIWFKFWFWVWLDFI